MITRIFIPQAFENMEEATIGRWLKNEGDLVQNGDPLCELITEKTTFDLPAENLPAAGVLRRVVAPEKSVVPVGYVIALVGELTDELPDVASENRELLRKRTEQQKTGTELSPADTPTALTQHAQSTSSKSTSDKSTFSKSTSAGSRGRIRATPAARRAAKEHGIALEELAKVLPGKVLTEDDILSAAEK